MSLAKTISQIEQERKNRQEMENYEQQIKYLQDQISRNAAMVSGSPFIQHVSPNDPLSGVGLRSGQYGPSSMVYPSDMRPITELAREVGELRERLARSERNVADFLAWLQWAHPEVREQYHKCLEVARRVDEANGEDNAS